MSGKSALSILIPWFERDELRLTLAANEPAFRAHEVEVLVLNCGGSSGRLRDLISASGATGVRQLDIFASRFNKSLALNIGLSYSRSDTILTLDADVVLLGDFLEEAKRLAGGESFVTIEWVYESKPAEPVRAHQRDMVNDSAFAGSAAIEFRFRDGTTVEHQLSRRDEFGSKRAGPGLLLARKLHLLEIQGLNSELEGWGWEDDDVLVRLQYALSLRRIQKGAALHLTHGDDRRTLYGSRKHTDQRNFIKCCRNYNNGLFLGTYYPDISWAADKVTETSADAEIAEAVVECSPDHHPPFLSGPMYCGDEDGLRHESPRALGNVPHSMDRLLLDATLKRFPLSDLNVLFVGPMSATINHRIVACNKYSPSFRGHLPFDAFDIIVDNNIASYACCQQHLMVLMENYSNLLTPAGIIVTTQWGLEWSAADDCWKLSDADLASLAGQFGLGVTKTGYGVYTLRKQAPR